MRRRLLIVPALAVLATGCGGGNNDPTQTRARDVMSPDVQYCFDDSNIEDCASLMQDHQIRRLVVLDRNKRLVGIVSLGDLATSVHKDKLTGETLEAISRSGQPQR